MVAMKRPEKISSTRSCAVSHSGTDNQPSRQCDSLREESFKELLKQRETLINNLKILNQAGTERLAELDDEIRKYI